ncbi:hypothetical protein GCM10028810_50180 [Spirosoma litoris]
MSPIVNASLDSTQQTITATLPIGTDISKLAPTISLSSKATITPASGVAQDFSKPVSYTVSAEDGTTRVYTAQITVLKSSAKSIISFTFPGLVPSIKAAIDSVNRVITATVAPGTDLTKLTPTITISNRATVSPASGVVQDFSKSIVYTVTAENGERQSYTVQVNLPKSSSKFVRSFIFNSLSPAVVASIDTTNKTVVAVVPTGTDLTSLTPTIIVSDKAIISPKSGVAQNFQDHLLTYTVTAENGTKVDYRAWVTTIKDQPVQATLYQKAFIPTKILCKKDIFTGKTYNIQFYNKNVACSDFTIPPIEFNISTLAVGTYWGEGPYFWDGQGSTTSFFGCMVQITKVTATTIEGKLIGGQVGDNYIEGSFIAIICP